MVEKIRQYFVTCQKYMKFKFQYPKIKFYWNTATVINSHIISSCFYTTISGLNTSIKHQSNKTERACIPVTMELESPHRPKMTYSQTITFIFGIVMSA